MNLNFVGTGLWISLELPEHLWLFASLFSLHVEGTSVRIVMKTSKESPEEVKLGEGPSVPPPVLRPLCAEIGAAAYAERTVPTQPLASRNFPCFKSLILGQI